MKASDLDHRQSSRDDQSSRNKILLLVGSQVRTSGAGHDNRRSNDTGQHGKSMLEPKQEGQNHRHLVIEAEEGARTTRTLHERQIRGKEEGIVVVAEEAIASGECGTDGAQTLGNGLARLRGVVMRHDRLGPVVFVHCEVFFSNLIGLSFG